MSGAAAPPPGPAGPTRRSLGEWLSRNPVTLKELRGRMRGARAFVVLTAYLLVMTLLISGLYGLYLSANANVFSRPDRMMLGKVVFGSVVGIEMLLVCFIAPAFTVGAVSGERERQTYDLLRTTLLSERGFVLGKLASALAYVLLLLFAAVPLQSLAFLLGGVAPEEVLVATLLLFAAAFLYSAAGLFASTVMRRTLGATILTYAFALLTTAGLPLLLFPLVLLAPSLDTPSLAAQVALIYGAAALIVSNPLATIIATEAVLVNYQTLLGFSLPLYNPAAGANFSLPLVSPWLPYVLGAFLAGAGMVWASIQNVRRTDE